MKLQERLAHALSDLPRGGKAEIARITGKSQPSVTAWFSGDTVKLERRDAELITARFAPHINPRWLAEGVGLRLVPNTTAKERDTHGGFGPPPAAIVPLVSWVAAGAWASIADPYQPGVAEEWFSCPVRHSARAYALRVRGLSMFNPAQALSFNDGDIIFVEPERDARSGSLVIVRLEDREEATFKRLIVEGDQRLLEALNPSWPDRIIRIDGNATLCGVVIGKYQPTDVHT